MKKQQLILTIFFLSLAINSFSQNVNKGHVLFKWFFFDTSSNKYIVSEMLNHKSILFKGNYVIKPAYKIIWDATNGVTKKYEINTLYYYFIDIKAKRLYEYDTLNPNIGYSTTYLGKDSLIKSAQGNLFWKSADTSQQFKIKKSTFKPLCDTVIHNISYKREISDFYEDSIRVIIYCRYDIVNTIFHFDRSFDETRELPIVMVEFLYPESNMKQLLEISYERFYLTRKEKKVFKAWIKNAKKFEQQTKKE